MRPFASGTTPESLHDLVHVLEHAGHHPLTSWWLAESERFLIHPTAREWAARVGRGGTKSFATAVHAVHETLFGDFRVPPGERHYFAFISISKEEAAQRLRLLQSFLTALGVPFTPSGDCIDLDTMPRGFRVHACTIAAVSGFRCIGWAADEAAKWRSGDSDANPAREVIASIRAMTVTHPQARGFVFSSPLSTLDYHHDVVEAGETDRCIVSQAPTWIANPSISEEQTHTLEPDDRVWRREYAAIPQAGLAAAFEPALIDACFRDPGKFRSMGRVLVLDASGGGGDSFTAAVVGWCINTAELTDAQRVTLADHQTDNQHRRELGLETLPLPEFARPTAPPFVCFERLLGWQDRFRVSVDSATIAQQLAATCRRFGLRTAFGDQYGSFWVRNDLARLGVQFTEIPWTNSNKLFAVARLRHWLRERMLVLPTHEPLKRELHAYSEKVTPSGAITFGGRGQHDDFVALLVTAAMADAEGALRGSPHHPPVFRSTGGNVA